ncbi:MAG: ethylbenzene dehydrogenase-related protein [Pirellulaceae bacterium]|nr:ethylbenzene dehydrogenase-related protein [Pirellulaceae bacterium]
MNQERISESSRLLFGLMVGLTLIVVMMVVSIFLATRRPVVVVLPGGAGSGSETPLAGGSPTGPSPSGPPAEVKPIEEVSVTKLDSLPVIDNPLDPLWDRVRPQEITLAPQQVAEPTLMTGTVSKIQVQAAHDGSRYLWRLSWPQETPSVESSFATFSDAVAIQFPLVDGAPYTMGGPNQPVAIFYWRALWQLDVDAGFQDTVVTRPNAYNDFYWFADQTGPVSAVDLATNADPMAMQWMIAAKSNNPMADFGRKCPMEELKAHGFGTSTHVSSKSGPGNARGVWHEGRWYVVFERQVTESEILFQRFKENPQQQLIAFAVWDGQAQNRGGQKNISNWIPMRITP